MELSFKDKKSQKLFENTIVDNSEEDKLFLEEMANDNEVEVSSSLSLDSLEKIAKKETIVKSKPLEIMEVDDVLNSDIKIQISQLNRIESKQNAILEALEEMSKPTIQKNIKNTTTINRDDEDILKLNLELFYTKLIIISTNSKNRDIQNLLITLQDISQHLFSNSFYIFSKDNSPIKEAINMISLIGMGDSILNNHIDKTEKLLKEIDSFGKDKIFQQHYNFANLLLDKGLLLNSITLFNELIGVYIIESIKTYSKNIDRYIQIVGEEDNSKLYSQAKEFIDNIFVKKNKMIPLFPKHIAPKDIDKEIAKKLENINRTWSNRGDKGVFEKYIYISNRVRYIRNRVAHANMDISFKDINSELKKLIIDFNYLAIEKNIFKK